MKHFYKPIITLLLTLLYVGCLFDSNNQAGGGSETGNVGGTVIASDGLAKANADVHLFLVKLSVDSLQASPQPILSTKTNANGYYSFNVPEINTYTIIAQSESEIAFIDSLSIAPESNVLQDIALKAPGSLQGAIKLRVELKQPSSVVAYLNGTSFYQNLSDSGTLNFQGIPEGSYTLILIPNQLDFSNTILQVTIQSGLPTIIEIPIELQYNGIPIPESIISAYDTTSGSVTISWGAVNYPHLKEYLIEKNNASNLKPSWELIGRTSLLSFTEIIYSNSDPFKINPNDTTTKTYEYRVRVRSNYSNADGSSLEGAAYGINVVEIVSQRKFLPYAQVSHKSILVESTPMVTLSGVGSSTFGEATMAWDVGNTGVFEPTIDGTLSFLFYERNITDPIFCIFKVTDPHGNIAQDTSVVTVNHQSFLATANAGNDIRLNRSRQITLSGSGVSPLGLIDHKEWKVSGGDWIITDSIQFTTSNTIYEDTTKAYLRVTDIRGISNIDSINIIKSVLPEVLTSTAPFYGNQTTLMYHNNEIWAVVDTLNRFYLYTSIDGKEWNLLNDSIPFSTTKNLSNRNIDKNYISSVDSLSMYSVDKLDSSTIICYSTSNGVDWNKSTLTKFPYKIFNLRSVTQIEDNIYVAIAVRPNLPNVPDFWEADSLFLIEPETITNLVDEANTTGIFNCNGNLCKYDLGTNYYSLYKDNYWENFISPELQFGSSFTDSPIFNNTSLYHYSAYIIDQKPMIYAFSSIENISRLITTENIIYDFNKLFALGSKLYFLSNYTISVIDLTE